MDNGWETSAEAWIADQGERGDFGRKYVLDPVMVERALARPARRVLDVGCGEGRFCRVLGERGLKVTGLDPTTSLIRVARQRDARGAYVQADGERLPFGAGAFDLVVSYLTLIDIPDARAAMAEMARVLEPGGRLLIANLTSFNTAGAETGWVKDASGAKRHYPVDEYLAERVVPVEYRGIRIVNHHRPLRYYMSALLEAGLELTFFDEPDPTAETSPSRAASYRRAPWFLVMEWRKPA